MDIPTLRFGARMALNRLRGRHSPFIVQLTLLNSCNYQCSYCYAEYYQRGGKRMPLEQVRFVLDELARFDAFRVNLVGGEPLIRKDIGDIVDHGKRLGLLMVMTTNGFFVRDRMETMKKLHSVCISLDGDEASNDKNRGAGTWKKTMDGIEALREAGMPVNFSTVLTAHNCDQVDYMVDLARRCRGFVDFTPLISQAREGHEDQPALWPPREKLDAALRRILELRRSGAPIGFTETAYQHALDWPDYGVAYYKGTNPPFNDVACLAGRDYIFIDFNGDIYPCPQQVGLLKRGNIFTDGFETAWKIAAGHDCKACPQTCTTDLSLFFAGEPEALVGKLRHSRAKVA